MRETLQARLDAKVEEYRTTQATLTQIEQAKTQTMAALLRLEGAILALREVLAEHPLPETSKATAAERDSHAS